MKRIVGLQIIHNHRPVELLHRIDNPAHPNIAQLWRVRPLFVDDPKDHDLLIYNTDTCKPLHTQTNL